MSLSNFTRSIKSGNFWVNVAMVFGLLVVLLVPPEAYAQAGSVYRANSTQAASSQAITAVVLQKRDVHVETSTAAKYGGGAVGAIVGGALGAKLGENSQTAKVAVGLIGSILGGLAGNAVSENIGGPQAVEYIVETMEQRGNRILAITQPMPAPVIAEGSQVYLIQTGNTWRLVPAAPRLVVRAPAAPQISSDVDPSGALEQSYRYREDYPTYPTQNVVYNAR